MSNLHFMRQSLLDYDEWLINNLGRTWPHVFGLTYQTSNHFFVPSTFMPKLVVTNTCRPHGRCVILRSGSRPRHGKRPTPLPVSMLLESLEAADATK